MLIFSATVGLTVRWRFRCWPRSVAMLLLRQAKYPLLAAAGHWRVSGWGRLCADIVPCAWPTGLQPRVRRLGPAYWSEILYMWQLFARTGSILSDKRRKCEYLYIMILSIMIWESLVILVLKMNIKKGEKLGVALLYSICRVCNCNGCIRSEFNDKLLHVKNVSKRIRCVI